MSNVIDVVFRGSKDQDAIAGPLQPEIERMARERGYSTERVAEVTRVIAESIEKMLAYNVNFTLDTTGLEMPAAIDAAARLTTQQLIKHCGGVLVIAAAELSYPKTL